MKVVLWKGDGIVQEIINRTTRKPGDEDAFREVQIAVLGIGHQFDAVPPFDCSRSLSVFFPRIQCI